MMSTNKNNNDHYAALNITSSATYDEIKRAYHKAALILHPDKQQMQHQQQLQQQCQRRQYVNDNCNNKFVLSSSSSSSSSIASFQRIQEAWECLSTIESRKQYDYKMYIQSQRIENKRNNAVMIQPNECSIIESPSSNEYKDCDNDNDSSGTVSGSGSGSADGIVLLYICRCGYKIRSDELEFVNNDVIVNDFNNNDDCIDIDVDTNTVNVHSENETIIQCPGCSLTYNVELLLSL